MIRVSDSIISEAACNRSRVWEAKDSRAHFPCRRKRSQSFLWKRHWYPACQHRRWLGKCWAGAKQLRTLVAHWTSELWRVCVCAGLFPVMSCSHVAKHVSVCVWCLGSLSLHNPASCLRSVWKSFLCHIVQGIRDLINSGPSHLSSTCPCAEAVKCFDKFLVYCYT